jgi:membrane-associated phospholipid phosphatase
VPPAITNRLGSPEARMNALARIEDFFEALDQWADFRVAALASGWPSSAMNAATYLGSFWVVLLIVIGIAIFLRKHRAFRQGVALLAIFATGEVFTQILKLVFHRARPASISVHAFGASFPSGHAFTAIVVYGFIVHLLWQRRIRHFGQWTACLVFIILLIGFSRIYLHAHYLTDVLGGYVLGLAWLISGIRLFRIKLGKG